MKYMLDGDYMGGDTWCIGASSDGNPKVKRFLKELEDSDSQAIRLFRDRIRRRLSDTALAE